MRLDNLVSIHLYCDCQAQRLQYDATFDLLIVVALLVLSIVDSNTILYFIDTKGINLN